ncbi:MAG TPA: response regulator, partial [Methanotrichaceae archaeon]|nr:response regulator [Methanotrichaceae archaeon]
WGLSAVLADGNSSTRILLAEDNPLNQKVTMLMLGRLGYKADAVDSGQKVLDAFKSRSYSLVLMNIRLPEMDGLTAARKIRSLCPDWQQPWIIAFTAYICPGSRDACLNAGMDDFMAKPVRLNELGGMMRKYLSSGRSI